MNTRIYVEKKVGFDVEAVHLTHDIRKMLGIDAIKNIRVINIYDIFEIDEATLERAKGTIFSEPPCDNIYADFPLSESSTYFAVEYLPGQFDKRANSTIECLNLIANLPHVDVKTGKIICIESKNGKSITADDLERIKSYYINKIEMREKDLSKLEVANYEKPSEVEIIEGFINYSDGEVVKLVKDMGLSVTDKDVLFARDYFKSENRNPTETELRVIDTYWSDHCRHTTFETELKNISFNENSSDEASRAIMTSVKEAYDKYITMRKEVHKDRLDKKPLTLMDIATIYTKYAKQNDIVTDVEISEEVNACSVYMDIDIDGKIEKWLLLFKNETHNHPTEIEPFGGASTCLGGAIRDPLSSRAYVYQAMRVTGAGNPLEKIEDTIKGKLPQEKITKSAAHGYSSYGNQIGIATSHVSEIYHDGYKAKRMEVGAVIGATPLENVRREVPTNGDKIILLGGATGRDGVGGATGSSKVHTDSSLEQCSAEVQKGNAIEERKLERLFRNKIFTTLVKRCNDFGAGGVVVAIGELSSGMDIDLSKLPLKYQGLNGTEIAISESQERMAVVVEDCDVEKVIALAKDENIEATLVATVTDSNRLKIKHNEKYIVDISRDFLDTHGVRCCVDVEVASVDVAQMPIMKSKFDNIVDSMGDLNTASQKGLVEMFDSSIGSGNVLMPYGGKYQNSPTDVSVHKVSLESGHTNTCSAMSWGYEPTIATCSTFHAASYAIVDSISKLVAAGFDYKNIKLSFQEYFERLHDNPKKWALPFNALLAALHTQEAFGIAAIGGKDSMSGSFNDISVPPTFISFAFTYGDCNNVISTEFKRSGNYIYLIKHSPKSDLMPNIDEIKENYSYIYNNIKSKNIVSSMVVKIGGAAEAVAKMALGNKLGADITNADVDIFSYMAGSIIVESTSKLDYKNAVLLGTTTEIYSIVHNGKTTDLDSVEKTWQDKLHSVFAYKTDDERVEHYDIQLYQNKNVVFSKNKTAKPKVFIPIFPGTNCEYDTKRVFENNGAVVETLVFNNMNNSSIAESIAKMSEAIKTSQILMFAGGFSAADEPDGSGKFIANTIMSDQVKMAIEIMLANDGLVLGICNGFQALIKSGLLPYGQIGKQSDSSATLTFNKIGRHISQMVNTKVVSNLSPWLSSVTSGDVYTIPVSHGEGRFVASDGVIKSLIENNQVATQYVDFDGVGSSDYYFNPNGSNYAIEGITSADGKIFGKMGHVERMGDNLYKNIIGSTELNIFANGVKYFS